MTTNQLIWKAARDANGKISYFLSGSITENSPMQKFASEIQAFSGHTISLDMSGVHEVNSSGIANWMKFIEFLKNNNIKAEFVNCSVTIIQQMNMVRQFNGGFKVKSLFAPYFCPNCDEESEVLVTIPEGATSSIVDLKDSLKCETCNNNKEFDDIADSYLSFLDIKQ